MENPKNWWVSYKAESIPFQIATLHTDLLGFYNELFLRHEKTGLLIKHRSIGRHDHINTAIKAKRKFSRSNGCDSP